MLKYEILYDQPKNITRDKVVYRIRALQDFSDVKAGDIGGYIEWGMNLSQAGNCWIYDDACCFGYGSVIEDACIKDYALVWMGALIKGSAIVSGESLVYENSVIGGKTIVTDDSGVDYSKIRAALKLIGNHEKI